MMGKDCELQLSKWNGFGSLRATYDPHNQPTECIIRYTIEKF